MSSVSEKGGGGEDGGREDGAGEDRLPLGVAAGGEEPPPAEGERGRLCVIRRRGTGVGDDIRGIVNFAIEIRLRCVARCGDGVESDGGGVEQGSNALETRQSVPNTTKRVRAYPRICTVSNGLKTSTLPPPRPDKRGSCGIYIGLG